MDEISRLHSSKSCWPNSLPVYILNTSWPYISNALATLNNQSFSKGILPSELKMVQVLHFVKTCDSEIASSYNPISLLSILLSSKQEILKSPQVIAVYHCLPIVTELYEKLMYKILYS